MLYQVPKKKLLALVLVYCIGFAGMCNSKDPKTRTLAKATDDFAEGQQSAARLLANAKTTGLVSQEDINEIKPFLQQANDLNAQAIEFGKKLLADPNNQFLQKDLVTTINQISSVLVRANNVGLFRIKDEKTRIAFNTIVAMMQAAATSAITIFKVQ